MFKLLKKIVVYSLLILLVLEGLVRVFHLHNELPERYLDENGINKWIPNQKGYAVYGNRRQNFTQYQINKSGYNSYRDFTPTKDNTEIAIIGDSFIEGFHQDYNKSIGKKIENQLPNVHVYEYGHSSADLADHLYLIQANKEDFKFIDHYIIGVKYKNDLTRSEHKPIKHQPFFPMLRHSKLVVYLINIGAADVFKEVHQKILNLRRGKKASFKTPKAEIDKDSLYLENFKQLLINHEFNKKKTTFLLDSRTTSAKFLTYLNTNNIRYIDFAPTFNNTNRPTTLIYDQHWNNFGRTLIANDIVNYIRKENIIN